MLCAFADDCSWLVYKNTKRSAVGRDALWWAFLLCEGCLAEVGNNFCRIAKSASETGITIVEDKILVGSVGLK